MKPEDMTPGESYGCRYTVTAMLDKQGYPAQGQPGDAFPGPGEYTGFGLVQTRDVEQKLLRLWDPELKQSIVVGWDDIELLDRVEYTDAE